MFTCVFGHGAQNLECELSHCCVFSCLGASKCLKPRVFMGMCGTASEACLTGLEKASITPSTLPPAMAKDPDNSRTIFINYWAQIKNRQQSIQAQSTRPSGACHWLAFLLNQWLLQTTWKQLAITLRCFPWPRINGNALNPALKCPKSKPSEALLGNE